MQLGLIFGIVFAIISVIFAMQNIAPATVRLGFWSFEGSLALVLLATLGLGALIAGLVSSPAMIRRQWNVARLSRLVAELERKLADAERRNDALRAELTQARSDALEGTPPATAESADEKPYVGLRALMAGKRDDKQTM